MTGGSLTVDTLTDRAGQRRGIRLVRRDVVGWVGGHRAVRRHDRRTGWTYTGSLSVAGGSLNLGTYDLGLDGAGSAGVAQMSDGSVYAANFRLGIGGSASVSQQGGYFSVDQSAWMGVNTGSSGTYTINGGSLSVGGDLNGGQGASTVVVDGGTLSVGGALMAKALVFNDGGWYAGSVQATSVVLGRDADADAAYDMSGSSFYATTETLGQSGAGTFTQYDGTHEACIVLGQEALSSGTYAIYGGSLTANDLQVGLRARGAEHRRQDQQRNGPRRVVLRHNGHLTADPGSQIHLRAP